MAKNHKRSDIDGLVGGGFGFQFVCYFIFM